MLKRISAFIESLIRQEPATPRKPYGVIEHDAAKIRLTKNFSDGSEHVLEVGWGAVSRVVAYKRDAMTHDVIALGFLGTGIDVNEDMEGWDELLKKLPEYLPGCQPFEQWFQAVAFPAFAMNPTDIYRREEPAPGQAETRAEGQAEAQTEASAEGDALS
jgi:hypothetical protein